MIKKKNLFAEGKGGDGGNRNTSINEVSPSFQSTKVNNKNKILNVSFTVRKVICQNTQNYLHIYKCISSGVTSISCQSVGGFVTEDDGKTSV